jgi:predicted kinase
MQDWLQQLQQTATPTIDECVAVLGPHIPWLTRLVSTSQDPEWHAEGNVHIHTGMVLVQLYQLLAEEAAHIQGVDRQILILAAILHDIGKPRMTRPMLIRGQWRIGSPDHEAVGRSYLAFQLMKLDLPISAIWMILGLVGEHHMPKILVKEQIGLGGYIALSRRANLALLYWLERADMQGRIGVGIAQQLAHLDEFRRYAQTYGVWQHRYRSSELEDLVAQETPLVQHYLRALTIDALQRRVTSSTKELVQTFSQHKDHHSQLMILCGPSGIGKSRFVAQHCQQMAVVSLDQIREELHGDRTCQDDPHRVVARGHTQLKQYLLHRQHVVWDATNLRQDYRKPLYALGRAQHALITLVIFLAAEADIYRGNANRPYAVPVEVLDRQLASYQFPRVSDAHAVWVVGPDGDVVMTF